MEAEQAWIARRAVEVKHGLPDEHFKVCGPGRAYDHSTFCRTCFGDAVRCASDWIEEVADGLDVGEEVTVTLKVCPGLAEVCYGDVCRARTNGGGSDGD